jgi:Stage II sporulation protein E (SpoIIE)/Phosphoserine phosphatase RsbU, N-terminal domain
VTEASGRFQHAYRSALANYLASGDESGRAQAYELGRQAVADGVSLLELAALHRAAEADWLARSPEHFKSDQSAGTQFFLEALSTFDMAQRGFWEAQDRAQAERRHAQKLQELNEAVVAITAQSGYAYRLNEIVERARELVNADGAAIFTPDGDSVASTAGTDPTQARLQGHALEAQRQGESVRGSEPGSLRWLAVPMRYRPGDGVGSILIWGTDGDFAPTTEGLLVQLAHFASTSLDIAWQLAREHEAAVTLQESLLPAHLPRVNGLGLSFRYLPAAPGNEVGGDWYDAFTLDNGDAVLVVGDVAGHDLRAAALMGQLRLAIQAYAIDGYPPAEVLDRVDRLWQRIDTVRLATLVYMVVDQDRRRLRIANAGHLPPIMVTPGGEVRFLTDGLSIPLGVDSAVVRHRQAVHDVEPGSFLLLYTDGLVEDRALPIDDGLDVLAAAVAHFKGGPDELCNRVISIVKGERADDICLLAVAVEGAPDRPDPPLPSAPTTGRPTAEACP